MFATDAQRDMQLLCLVSDPLSHSLTMTVHTGWVKKNLTCLSV